MWEDEADEAEGGRRKMGGVRRRIDENMDKLELWVFLGEEGTRVAALFVLSQLEDPLAVVTSQSSSVHVGDQP